MEKVTREAEYFKNITHDEIDRQIQFLDRAMNTTKTIKKGGVHPQPLKIEEL